MVNKISLLVSAISLLVLTIAGAATAEPSGMPDGRLLALYEPVAHFDPLEQFHPTRVESFITDADLEQLVGNDWTVAKSHAAPGDLPGPGTGTWRLDQSTCTPAAPLGGLSCYSAAGNQGNGGSAVYGRVAHEDGLTVLES